MKMKKLLSLATVLVLMLSLTACGGASKNEMAIEYGYDSAVPMENGMLTTDSAASGAMALPADRKLIRTISMDAETEELETMLAALE